MLMESFQFQDKFKTMCQKSKGILTLKNIDEWAEHEINLLKRRLDLKQDTVTNFMQNVSCLRGVCKLEKSSLVNSGEDIKWMRI